MLRDVTLTLLGTAMVLLVLVDSLTTTVAVGAAGGPLTRRLAAGLWRLLLAVHRVTGRSAVLTVAGPLLLISAVVTWVVLLWSGWTLVALGAWHVVSSPGGEVAGVADTVYYTGFSVVTLGVGDYVATTPAGRVATAVASLTGLSVITLAITYLTSVVSAVVQRRALAVQIRALGVDPGHMVAGGWDGTQFSSAFVQRIVDLAPPLATIAEQHLAYPVLHYFRSSSRASAMPPALADLDDMLLLLAHAVASEARLPAGAVEPTRRVVDRYLETVGLTVHLPDGGQQPPAPPDVAPLRDAGVPLAPGDAVTRAFDDAGRRRGSIASMIAREGWTSAGPTRTTPGAASR